MHDAAVAFWGSHTLPRLLFHLTDHRGEEVTLGQLQRELDANRESLHRALQRALATGVVVRRKIGNTYAYRADETSPIYAEVKSLSSKLVGPAGLLAAALAAPGPPLVQQAFVYGSTARATDQHTSDIDVFVIGSATDFDLADILQSTTDRIERAVNAVVYTRHEVEEGLRRGDGFLLEVFAQPKSMLVGQLEDLPTIPEELRR